ncbi:hypothetical protein PENANT_c017G02184 [Penicillium antarcticum]|uniref:Rhodopsin domain-containing protein n=1 Tax=Penicillium antarcticum TaxID=416450 RepID=A0A1V6Q223_9EURO|nr:uncharacterized protein N7508_005345 [Penicillium antarcticum]KAJ5306330.1 hypothetical protein N7508_005345 [Penicillium antarcticum]OQD83293.1 hypothetical protein PENANT_c017G02184 [Penicillium antarcticum]
MIDDHHQTTALGIVVAFPILGGIAVFLRLWSRWLSRSALTSDDHFIIAGYVLAVSQSVTSWYYIKTNYVGIHIWDVPKDYNPRPGLVWNFANQLIYNPALTLVKVSILLFLRRLDPRSRLVKYLIWISMAVVVGLFAAVLLVDIFQCHPVAYVYDQTIPGGKCINQGAFYVSTAALNLSTDLMVLSIPIIITWRLQMPIRRKIAVCIILCLGGVATAIGVWRIIILANAFICQTKKLDPTYAVDFCSSAVEVNVAVVTACAPSLKAISTKFLPRLLGSSNGGGTGSGTRRGAHKRGISHISHFFSHRRSNTKSSPSRSTEDDGYEMADPLGGPRVGIGTGSEPFDMRKYKRGADSPSFISSDDDGVSGIVKTTDISIGYVMEPGEQQGRSNEARPASADSWV